VLEILVRLSSAAGPAFACIAVFLMAVVATFVLLTAIAMLATIRADDLGQRQIRYRIFRDLLGLFAPRKRQ
jgi:hypothetical protein